MIYFIYKKKFKWHKMHWYSFLEWFKEIGREIAMLISIFFSVHLKYCQTEIGIQITWFIIMKYSRFFGVYYILKKNIAVIPICKGPGKQVIYFSRYLLSITFYFTFFLISHTFETSFFVKFEPNFQTFLYKK